MTTLIVAMFLGQVGGPACYNPQAACSDSCTDSSGALVCTSSLEIGSASSDTLTLAGAAANAYPTITAAGSSDAGVAFVCPGYSGIDIRPQASGAAPSFVGTNPALGGQPALCLGHDHSSCVENNATLRSDGTNLFVSVPSSAGTLYVSFDGGGGSPGLQVTPTELTFSAASGPIVNLIPDATSTIAGLQSTGIMAVMGNSGSQIGTANGAAAGTQLWQTADGPLTCGGATEGLDAGTCAIASHHFLGVGIAGGSAGPSLASVAAGWAETAYSATGSDAAMHVSISTGASPTAISAGATAFDVMLGNPYSSTAFEAVISGRNEYGAQVQFGVSAIAVNELQVVVGPAGFTPTANQTYQFSIITMGDGATY